MRVKNMMQHTSRSHELTQHFRLKADASAVDSVQLRCSLRTKGPNLQVQSCPDRAHSVPHHQPHSGLQKHTITPQTYHKMAQAQAPSLPRQDRTLIIHWREMVAFFRLFEDDLIWNFVWRDSCFKLTDKYLLAMTFMYFKRAQFDLSEYNRMNFFIALYLAHTMEEEKEETKYEIFPWALGKRWENLFPLFLKQRDKLWARMDHRAAVSRHCCEQVMAIAPSHFIWQRMRAEHHSGVWRHNPDKEVFIPCGPEVSPEPCPQCTAVSPKLFMPLSSPLSLPQNFHQESTQPKPQASYNRKLCFCKKSVCSCLY